MFYNSVTCRWIASGTGIQTTLSGWQSASSKDTNSLSHNPNFVNASGTTAPDFKRSSYTENFTGYNGHNHAGAYETGNETIGIDWTTPADVTPPSAPTGLSVS